MYNFVGATVNILGRRPQLIVVVYTLVILIGFIGGARHLAEQAKVQAAYDTSKTFFDSVTALHRYYSKVIVPRIEEVGGEFAIHFENQTNKFPFPATVSARFSTALQSVNSELSANIYSRSPFPHLKGRMLDQFELESLAFLEKNPELNYFRIETKNGKEFGRFAGTMFMKQDCVECHNRPEFGFQGRWKVGDFRGARQVSLPVPSFLTIIDRATNLAVIFAAAAAILGGLMVWPVVSRLHRNYVNSQSLATQLAEKNIQLEEANDVKSTFFSIVAHDLRGPFTSILGFTKLMITEKDQLSKAEMIGFAYNINNAGNRLYLLVENLLKWSELQLSGAKYEPQMVNVFSMVEECIESLDSIASQKKIVVLNDVEKIEIFVDQNMVLMVIRNLIGNALKFTPIGGRIEVLSVVVGDSVKITVQDNGVGIPNDEIEELFNLNLKVSTPGTCGESGTGLGLHLCKEMIEKNNGIIWAESELGAGSKFHFIVPVSADGS